MAETLAYNVESCKPTKEQLINIKLGELGAKALFKPNLIILKKKDSGSHTISYDGIDLDLNFSPSHFEKVKDLTTKIIQGYITENYSGELFSIETVSSGFDMQQPTFLQVDNRFIQYIGSNILTPEEFEKIFGHLPTRHNGLMGRYASFLNSIIDNIKKDFLPECEKIIFKTPVINKIPGKDDSPKLANK